ncbi:beta-1,3-galactosyltransferase 5-like [Rhinophrynus dorsalis]
MVYIRTCRLKVLLCASAFLSFIVLWHQFSQSQGNMIGGWIWMFPFSATKGAGVDFSSLVSGYIVEPPCVQGLVVLILVTSHPGHIEQRKAIRKTWAAPSKVASYSWQVVFLIGRTMDVELDWHIHKEQVAHFDILTGNYLDTYRNLTLKVMHGIKWAADKCQPQYILKTDDDCFVNTEKLPAFLSHHNTAKTGLYVGSAFPWEKRMVIRDPASKWYVSYQDYNLDRYPPYASGIGYILSLDAARAVLRMAQDTAPLPIEDAYMGILAEKAGLSLRSSSRFMKHNIRWSVCNYRYLLVIHRLSPQEQELAQGNVLRAKTSCLHNKEVAHWK